MEQTMCGTSAIGSNATPPMKMTSVAGASGGGDVAAAATTAAGGSDLSALLSQITAAVEALKQAIAGMTNVAGATGGGAVTQGGSDAMAGCDMMGMPPMKQVEQNDSSVDGESGSGSKVDQGPSGKKDDSSVDGENGSGVDQTGPGGKVDQSGDDSSVGGDNGPGGKVDQTDDTLPPPPVKGGGGDAVAAAQAKLDAAKTDATAKHTAVTAAGGKVHDAQGGVTRAQDALVAANHRKTQADQKLIDAGHALEAAQKAGGSYTVKSGDTLDSIAKHYGISKDALLKANPSVTQSSDIKAGDTLKLPAGVGNGAAVKDARAKLDAARVEVNRAARAIIEAQAALDAAKAALDAAKAALKAAKEAATAADKAVHDAQKALDAAKKAQETPPTTPPGTQKRHYTTVKNDTVESVAKRYKITVKQLIDLNKATLHAGQHAIKVGTKLTLPPLPIR
jgi:LysM repeat protein